MVSKNKILIVGPSKSGKLTLVERLFGTLPEIPENGSHSGLIHEVQLKTKYYTKDLQIWIDEFEEEQQEKACSYRQLKLLRTWAKEFRMEEYKEIRDVITGIIFCVGEFENDDEVENYAEEIKSTLEVFKKDSKINGKLLAKKYNPAVESEDDDSDFEFDNNMWDGFSIISKLKLENESKLLINTFKEIFWDHDLDFASFERNEIISDKTIERDEYGDRIGLAKIKEIIECVDWNDIELKVPNEHYNTDKLQEEQFKEMKVPLKGTNEDTKGLEDDMKKLEIEELITKIKSAKDNVANIDSKESKEKFAKEFSEYIMKYL